MGLSAYGIRVIEENKELLPHVQFEDRVDKIKKKYNSIKNGE